MRPDEAPAARRAEPLDQGLAPPQFGKGVCEHCGHALSTYNPYWVCGPCRLKLLMGLEEGRPYWEQRLRQPIGQAQQ